jgi:predicted branched-subunit amino acid permease
MSILRPREFTAGMKDGMPVCVGYFFVSFGFGAMAVAQGLKLWHAVLMSAVNLTSAGQFAGLTVITAGAAMLELILTQLVINSRYALMSVALGQRLGSGVGIGKRMAMAFFNTDEVFALGMARGKTLKPAYFIGAGTVAALGWIAGTALGAVAGSILPLDVRSALGTMLYGMFVAIVVPQVREDRPMQVCVALALMLSCLFTWLPYLKQISAGIAIVLCTVGAAAVCAWLFPVADEEVAV